MWIKFFALLLGLFVFAGCTVQYVKPPPPPIFMPRQFEAVQEGNAGRRVWVYSRGARDLTGPLRNIEGTVGALLDKACGFTLVKRERGDVPVHRFRLEINQIQTSQTQDLGLDRRVRYQLYRVEAKMFLATNDELIATGVGLAAFSGEFRAERFSALRGLIRGIEFYPESPGALEGALRQAFVGLCYTIKRRPSDPDPMPRSEVPPEPASDSSWLYACAPPTCFERRTSGGLGFHKSGRVVGTPGVSLVRSGQTIRGGKIVPIR